MTLRDPLLQDLKGRIRSLVLSGSLGPFDDNDELVISLCLSLERIFSKGLSRRDGFTPWKCDAFQWFYQLVRKYQRTIPLVFKVAFDEVLGNSKTKTPLGKLRLLIRTCLKRRCLYVPVQFHVENEDFRDLSSRVTYNPESSILGHEILSQIFLSLVQQLSCYVFPFDLSNASFLDESWQLGMRVKVDMVPCAQLGLTLGFPLGFPLVVHILENSCAAEIQDLIGIGDILDEINGVFIRHYFGSKLDSLFKKVRSAPFQMTFIKGVNPKTGQVYLPVIKLYRILGLDPELIASRNASMVAIGTVLERRPQPPEPLRPTDNGPAEAEERDLLTLLEADDDPPQPSDTPAIFNLMEEMEAAENFVFGESIPSPTADEEDPVLNRGNHNSVEPQLPLLPYESQKNDSSASALNLQNYQIESDQLIV